MARLRIRHMLAGLIAAGTICSTSAQAALVTWTDWQDISGGSIFGTMGGVTATYSGPFEASRTQLGTGTNFWTENGTPAPYTGNSVIDNAPTPAEMIALNRPGLHTVNFSQAVLNPVMAIVSMGQPGLPVSYDFDTDFTVLSNGVGFWSFANGGLPGTIVEDDANDILTGREFHGAIQFNGLVNSISWSSSPAEFWHGITFGTPAVAVAEPASLALLGFGLAGIGFSRRRRQPGA